MQVKLDFCDLGRSIAGRPEDPIELRPFEFAFSKEKILHSCAKLGLSPVHLATALLHKRVRDDSADGSRATFEHTVRERHTATLQSFSQVGLLSGALEVEEPPPVVTTPTFAMLASPSKAEAKWKSLKAAGTSAGAIFHSVGAKAFNAPEITEVALERALEKRQADEGKNLKATSDFTLLRTKVQEIMERREEEELDWTDLSHKEHQDLITYIFKAKDEKGAGVHTKNAAASNTFMETFTFVQVTELIADPPCLKGKGRVAKGMSASVVIAEIAPASVLLLTGPVDTPYLAFGEVVDVDLGGYLPLKLPAWVESCLVLESPSAESLVGQWLLYKWPPRLGGWACGKVVAVNTDQTKKVNKEVCNYLVHYPVDDDTSEHYLNARDYAHNAKAVAGSWVCLGVD